MSKYEIIIEDITRRTYNVEADNEEDASKKVNNKEVEPSYVDCDTKAYITEED
jgi:hypothetical protein